ncbi:MAG: hypothetical protein Q4D42_04985 [Eubacteriales bacterium]|nr:hypothetical protein [Eubacteriales bacterium]
MAQAELQEKHIQTGKPIPTPAANGDVRLVWKLKGTGKKARRQTIDTCTEGQPVFIICDSNGSNCTIITENGDEIGKLNEKDSKTYHDYVEKYRYHVYIKRIRLKMEKPRIKILVIVHEKPQLSLGCPHSKKT